MSVCHGCGAPLAPNRAPGRARKWCSDRCRKRIYDLQCVDCGARVSGTDPGDRAGRDPRCHQCAMRNLGDRLRVWDRDAILTAIRWWAAEHGRPPMCADFASQPPRNAADAARVERARALMRAGRIPSFTTVVRAFGSWNAAVVEAGFVPRPAGWPRRKAAA